MQVIVEYKFKKKEGLDNMEKSLRVETHQIKRNNEWFDIIDNYCLKSKDLYNKVRWEIEQAEKNGNKFSCTQSALYKKFKKCEQALELSSSMANLTLKQLATDLTSFWKGYKSWQKNPEKFKSKPQMCQCKPAGEIGRTKLAWQVQKRKSGFKTGKIPIAQRRGDKAETIYLDFVQTDEYVKEIRFIPKPYGDINAITHYNVEIVYEIEVPEPIEEHNRIAGIDLGVDRLTTIATNIEGLQPICINGKPVKNMNAYYNKKRAKLMSYIGDRGTSNRIRKLTRKRNNKIKNYFHNASRKIVDWCVENQIDTIVIGKNKGWKNEVNIGKRNNQNFVSIPFNMLIQQIKYKAEEYGIVTIEQEESYTSSASMLDSDDIPVYKKGKKEKYDFSGYKNAKNSRGLYKSYEHGIIHRDVNAAYNIIRKKFGNIFDFEVERHPRVVNL